MQTSVAFLIGIIITSSITLAFIFYQRPEMNLYNEGGPPLNSMVIEKAVKLFLDEYQAKVTTQVNTKFRKHFYFNADYYSVIAIVSSNQMLINITEDAKSISYKIYLTNMNPQLKLHNIVHERNFADGSYLFTHSDMLNAHAIELSEKGMSGIHSLALDGWLIPIKIVKDASVLITGLKWEFEVVIGSNLTKFTTELPGSTVIIGTDIPEEASEYMKEAAIQLFNFQLQTIYINSEPFRKALLHPVLTSIAGKIKSKQAKADNKVREYPFWEFEEDIIEMRSLAKKHDIDDEYVNAVINDNQYKPLSGTLIRYYEGPQQFMMQWVLINSLLLLTSVAVVIFIPDRSHILHGAVAALFTIANGFIIAKLPSPMHMGWWIVPMVVLAIAYLILFFEPIFKTTN